GALRKGGDLIIDPYCQHYSPMMTTRAIHSGATKRQRKLFHTAAPTIGHFSILAGLNSPTQGLARGRQAGQHIMVGLIELLVAEQRGGQSGRQRSQQDPVPVKSGGDDDGGLPARVPKVRPV